MASSFLTPTPFLYIFIATFVFGLFALYFLANAYSAVCKRKESYLEVFFEIGNNVIKNSLEKCEKFSKKIQSDNLSETGSNYDETELTHEANAHLIAAPTIKSKSSVNIKILFFAISSMLASANPNLLKELIFVIILQVDEYSIAYFIHSNIMRLISD